MMEAIDLFLKVVGVCFVIYLVGYATFLFISVVIGTCELYHRFQQKRLKNELPEDIHFPISILVPAHNEETTVIQTIQSLLHLDNEGYEIIVVDDGSSDHTAARIIETFALHAVQRPIRRQLACQPEKAVYETVFVQGHAKIPLTLIQKKNGGKADALNMGINAARYPYFICLDADSVLQHDSLRFITQPLLEKPHVVAVGGLVRLSNDVTLEHGRVKNYRLPHRLLACMQVLEYDRSFFASRILLDKFNGSLIISGAFGLFQKDLVIAAGGYETNTLGEDMELVVKLHEYCVRNQRDYQICYAPDAICWTQAPETLRDLIKQRRRWYIGLFQTMHRYRRICFNPKFGAVSFVSYLYFLIYELLSPFIEIFGVFTMLLAFALDLINVPFMLLFFCIYAVFGAIVSFTAFFSRMYTADQRMTLFDVGKACVLCLFELTFLRFALAWVRATAFVGYKKKRLQWGSLERKEINFL